jgi:hypothetical protein
MIRYESHSIAVKDLHAPCLPEDLYGQRSGDVIAENKVQTGLNQLSRVNTFFTGVGRQYFLTDSLRHANLPDSVLYAIRMTRFFGFERDSTH